MTPEPEFSAFAEAYGAGRPQVVWTRLIADLETPVSAMLKLADGRPYSFLLESVEGGTIRGRYSFIGLKPDLIWRCTGDRAEVNRSARFDPQAFEPERRGALASLRALVEESAIDIPPELPPMAAGLVGYGCVGDVHSPGTSVCGTGRSSMGQTGSPVARSNT